VRLPNSISHTWCCSFPSTKLGFWHRSTLLFLSPRHLWCPALLLFVAQPRNWEIDRKKGGREHRQKERTKKENERVRDPEQF
jgi:hypothetical protein